MASNTADLGFNIFAFDRAAKTFIKLAAQLERLDEKLDNIDGRHATAHVDVDVDKGLRNIDRFADTSVSVMAGAFRIVSANAIVMAAAVAAGLAALPAVAALAGTGIVLGIGGALSGIGILAAAQSKEVRKHFASMWKGVVSDTKQMAKPFEQTLHVVANVFQQTFDTFAPHLEKAFARMAPVVSKFVGDLGQAFNQLAPMVEPMSRAFDAVLRSLGPKLAPVFSDISDSMIELSRTVRRNADDFSSFIALLLRSVPLAITGVSKLAQMFVDMKSAITRSLADSDSTLSRLVAVLTELGRTALPLVQSSLFGTLSGLQTLAQLALTLAEAFAKLPEPVQQFGLALAGAALVAPKITGAMSSMVGSVGGFISGVRDAETRTQRLAQAARSAAGAAGLAGLVLSAQASSGAMKVFGNAASGALMGFSVGGGWGAAIGGVAGALLGLSQATGGASSAQENYAKQAAKAAEVNERLKSTIDQVTGAYTRQTRVEVARALQEGDLGPTIDALGISYRDLTRAILGNDKAWGNVVAQIHRANRAGLINDQMMKDMLRNLRNQFPALKRESQAIRESQAAADSWKRTLKSLPKKVVTELREIGFAPTAKKVAQLARQYKLTPKQIQTIIKAMGVDASLKDIKRIMRGLDGVDKKTAKPKVDMGPAKQQAASGAAIIKRTWNSLVGAASSAGQAAGSALGAGVQSGISGYVGSVAAAAANLVNMAEQAARSAADAHSPSRKWKKLGIDMVRGLKEGLLDRTERGQIRQAVNDIVSKANDALDRALDRVKAALQARTDIVRSVSSGFTSSIFGGTRGTHEIPLQTPGQMIQFAKRERHQARRVNFAIRNVLRKGLSKSLVRQLLAQGEAGQEQLFALSGDASRKEIRRLNRLNAQRLRALRRAGLAAGNMLVGGRIERARDRAQEERRDVRQAKRMAHEIEKMLHKGIRLKIDKRGNAWLYKRGG